jgi:hypothetical protein
MRISIKYAYLVLNYYFRYNSTLQYVIVPILNPY